MSNLTKIILALLIIALTAGAGYGLAKKFELIG